MIREFTICSIKIKDGRKEWARLLKMLRPGDTVYFDSVSRMSSNPDEGFEDYMMLIRQKEADIE